MIEKNRNNVLKVGQKLLILSCWFFSFVLTAQEIKDTSKPRLLVLTDLGADPDDIQSLRRLLLYSNEFEMKGIIATAAGNNRSPELTVNVQLVAPILNDYEKVFEQLSAHASGYPTAKVLEELVFEGAVNVGVGELKPGKISEGAEHIIKTVDSSEEILNIPIWGGSHDLAQALLQIHKTRNKEGLESFISKLRVYAIADQYPNGFEMGTGQFIRENFPRLFFIESGPGWIPAIGAAFRGMYQNDSKGGGHPTLPLVRKGIEKLNNEQWLNENIRNKGPLGKGFPIVNQNPGTERNTKGIKEGDSPSWFYFLPHGLSDPEHPEWGSWGGRFEHFSNNHYVDAQDDHWSGNRDGALRRKWTVARWRAAYQNDFAARMDWCVSSYGESNHNPVATVDDNTGKGVVYRDAKPGDKVVLDGSLSSDPDEDGTSYHWWIYDEVSTSEGILMGSKEPKVTLEIPSTATKGEIHLVFEVVDNGSPNLNSYRRIIINVL